MKKRILDKAARIMLLKRGKMKYKKDRGKVTALTAFVYEYWSHK